MPLHLVKIAVGIDSEPHLATAQARRLDESRRSGDGRLRHFTRSTPKRAEEILDGGSIYWVIRGNICARQRIRDIETHTEAEGRRRCALVLDPRLRRTVAVPMRSFQGWRYLDARDAPPDLKDIPGADRLPADLVAELRELGLL